MPVCHLLSTCGHSNMCIKVHLFIYLFIEWGLGPTWYSFRGIDVKIWQIFVNKNLLLKWHMVSCGSMHYAPFIIGYPDILGVLH